MKTTSAKRFKAGLDVFLTYALVFSTTPASGQTVTNGTSTAITIPGADCAQNPNMSLGFHTLATVFNNPFFHLAIRPLPTA